MKKNKFYMTIGVPGSGKSTWAKKQDAIIHSSDSIREELLGKYSSIDEVPNGEVFSIMLQRTKASLTKGENVVYDATNMSRKDRKYILNRVQDFGAIRVGVLFLVPISECKRRNESRERTVPEFVIDKMLKRFDVPLYGAEFDEILIVAGGEMNKDEYNKGTADYMNSFDQHSPYHTLTLGEHMDKAWEIYDSEYGDKHPPYVVSAVKLHDIGKPHTFFVGEDNKGHFYGHENVGAYWYLTRTITKNTTLNPKDLAYKTAVLINWHMRPYVWGKSEKAKLRDLEYIDRYDPDMYGQLMAISKADRKAH